MKPKTELEFLEEVAAMLSIRLTECQQSADYEDEPEIVESEITLNPESNIWGYKCPCSGDPVNADLAHSCPGFRLIGFKFENGKIRSVSTVYGKPNITITQFYEIDESDLGDCEVFHATHVLFRQKAKE